MTDQEARSLTKEVLERKQDSLYNEVLQRLNNPLFVSSDAVFQVIRAMTTREAGKFVKVKQTA